jgi:hemerythrin
MKFIEWTENEILQVPKIDEQHLGIVKLVNDIYPQLGKLDQVKEISYTDELVFELRTHFDTEEDMMKCSKYPGYISHKLEHDRFYHKVQKIHEKAKSGDPSITLELLNTLKTWLFNHLEINDRKCADFFLENGCE